MPATALQAPLTLDAFLEWEERQTERYELVGGIVRMMAGGTEDHDRIGLNIAAALRTRLRGTPCYAHGSNLKVLSREAGASMYPDVFVRCGGRDGSGAWRDATLEGLDAVLLLPEIGVTLPLTEIYEDSEVAMAETLRVG